MSQYIPGVVDYVPQIQPYKPNLNFYQQVLETKNAQYKQGYDKLSSLYGNLLESPMLRDENIDLRNKFFNDIGAQISKISGLDLSLSQNVDAASKIFQPLIDNKYILKDMAYTKRAYNELQRGENFRNCTDEKKCGGKYWDGGIRAVQYQMADFAKSTADESLGFDAPKFTPYVNVPEKAMKFAKEMDFNLISEGMSADGRYKIVTKNGVPMIPSLTNTFLSVFQNDQAAVDYYKTQAYLERKDFVAQNAEKYGSDVDAEKYYLTQMSQQLFNDNGQKAQESAEQADQADLVSKVSEQQIKDRGIDPNDPNDQKLAATNKQSKVDKLIAIASQEYYDNTKNEADPQTLLGASPTIERSRIDNAVANSLFSNDLYNAASSYAMLTSSVESEADPYALASYKAGVEHSLSLDRMRQQFLYDVELAKQNTAFDILKEGYNSKKAKDALGKSNDPLSNDWIPAVLQGGGGGNLAQDPNLLGTDKGVVTDAGMNVQDTSKKLIQLTFNRLQSIIDGEIGNVIGNGVKITKESKELARKYKAELLGWSYENERPTKKESSGGVLSFLAKVAASSMSPSKASEIWKSTDADQEGSDYSVPTTYNGGYLDKNGQLIDLNKSTSFTDGNNKNNWYYTTGKIQGAIKNDPLLLNMLGSDTDLSTLVNNQEHSVRLYNAAEKSMAKNIQGVKKVVTDNFTNEILGKTSITRRDYAKQQLENNIVKNNRVVSKEEFVNNYVKNSPPVVDASKNYLENRKAMPFPMTDEGMPLAGTEYYSSPLSPQEEAEVVYNRFVEQFSAVYNQEKGKPTFKDQKSPKYGFIKEVGGAGAYVETQPVMIPLVDAAYPGDEGAQSFMGFMRNFESVYASNINNIVVVNKDGSEIDADVYDDLTSGWSNSLSDRIDMNAYNTLAKIANDFRSGKKIEDEDRARFSFVVHPIIAGDANKVGFTIKLNPEFRGKNQGGENTYGSTKGLVGNDITVVMDKSDMAPYNEAYQQTQRTEYDLLMDADNEVNISYPYGGSANIKRNPNGQGFIVSKKYNFFDENGNIVALESRDVSDPRATPGQIAQNLNNTLQGLNQNIYDASEALRKINPNIIKDPSQLR